MGADEQHECRITIRVGPRFVSIRGHVLEDLIWDNEELGLLTAEAMEMIGVPRPTEAVAKMCEFLCGAGEEDLSDRVGRAVRGLADAADEVLAAWRERDDELDRFMSAADPGR